jgi:hypothetical protein
MSLIRLLKRQGKVVGKTAAIFMSLILGAALAQAQVAPAAPARRRSSGRARLLDGSDRGWLCAGRR